MAETNGFTRRELGKITGAPPYTLAYLRDCGRLPVVKESTGSGVRVIYSKKAVEIVRRHLERNSVPA